MAIVRPQVASPGFALRSNPPVEAFGARAPVPGGIACWFRSPSLISRYERKSQGGKIKSGISSAKRPFVGIPWMTDKN